MFIMQLSLYKRFHIQLNEIEYNNRNINIDMEIIEYKQIDDRQVRDRQIYIQIGKRQIDR